jgi:hypothetical protein
MRKNYAGSWLGQVKAQAPAIASLYVKERIKNLH